MSVSLDGYFEGPDGDLGWHLVDEELHAHFNHQIAGMSAFLDGRVDYELMASYWPTADQDPDASPPEKEFAAIWRDMPKIVFSRTLESAGWRSEEHTSELQSRQYLVCRLLLEKKKRY